MILQIKNVTEIQLHHMILVFWYSHNEGTVFKCTRSRHDILLVGIAFPYSYCLYTLYIYNKQMYYCILY